MNHPARAIFCMQTANNATRATAKSGIPLS